MAKVQAQDSALMQIRSSFLAADIRALHKGDSLKLLGLAYLNKPSLVAEKSEPLVILRSAFWEGNVACSSLISLCEMAIRHYGIRT